MTSSKIVAIAIALAAATVRADNCVGATKEKATLTGLYCNNALTTAAQCGAACCETDALKCGAMTVTCDAHYFKDSAKAAVTGGADATAQKTNCCTLKAKCDTWTCATAYKAITAAATTDCAGATCSSGDAGTCCVLDPLKCGGNSVSCDSGYFQDSSKIGDTAGADAAAMQTNCCTAKAKCSTYTCAAGMKLITDAATTNCTTATCSSSDASTCCEADTLKCGGNSVSCDAHYFNDPAKAGITAGANAAAMKTNCCTLKAKCNTYTCAATATKAISAAATTDCSTATCSSSDASTCCETDTAKCGGNSVTCDAGFFQDTAKAGVAAGANAAAMKTNCCTDKATCAAFKAATAGITNGASKSETVVMTLMLAIVGVALSN